jgi:hypothetical protein
MIRVSVGKENRIELGKRCESDSGSAHTGQKPSQRGVEIRVSQQALAASFN